MFSKKSAYSCSDSKYRLIGCGSQIQNSIVKSCILIDLCHTLQQSDKRMIFQYPALIQVPSKLKN